MSAGTTGNLRGGIYDQILGEASDGRVRCGRIAKRPGRRQPDEVFETGRSKGG